MNQRFEEQRAILLDAPEPYPFTVKHYLSLGSALAKGNLLPEDHCLVAVVNQTTIVLPTVAMVYHHVAQGELNGLNWMVAFCCLCNSGSVFDAKYKGSVYHFAAQGYYDVMVLIADQETQSYWNHLTGECLHGELAGAELIRLNGLLQMRAAEALSAYPQAQFVLIDDLSDEETTTAERWNTIYRLPENPNYGDGLNGTGAITDDRLPRHDMGLGLWTATTTRYYSILELYENDGLIVDTVDGRTVIVTVDPDIGLPTAFYSDVDNVSKSYDKILLGDDTYYSKGMIYVNNERARMERPNHNAIRWYAFSALFPNCEIYGRK